MCILFEPLDKAYLGINIGFDGFDQRRQCSETRFGEISPLLKAGIHWRFCPAFSSDVFAKDIYYFHSIGFSFFFSWYVGHLGRDGFKNRKFSIF